MSQETSCSSAILEEDVDLAFYDEPDEQGYISSTRSEKAIGFSIGLIVVTSFLAFGIAYFRGNFPKITAVPTEAPEFSPASQLERRVAPSPATPPQPEYHYVPVPMPQGAVQRHSYNRLPEDRPFPANGLIQRTLPLQGRLARLEVRNTSNDNLLVFWFYNVGQGEQEAARMYVAARQAARIDLPTFDYRMAAIAASPSKGLISGFGPSARMTDLGFVDLKRPTANTRRLPEFRYRGRYQHPLFIPGIR